MERWIDRFCQLLEWALVLLLAGMVVMVFGNVTLRYAFNSGITVSEELSRWFFLWVIFLGAILVLRNHGHMGTDMLVAMLPERAQRVVMAAGHVLMLWVTWLLLKGGVTQLRINWQGEAPVTGLSMAWVYASSVVFAAVSFLLLLLDLYKILFKGMTLAHLHEAHLAEPPAQPEAQQRAGGDK